MFNVLVLLDLQIRSHEVTITLLVKNLCSSGQVRSNDTVMGLVAYYLNLIFGVARLYILITIFLNVCIRGSHRVTDRDSGTLLALLNRLYLPSYTKVSK